MLGILCIWNKYQNLVSPHNIIIGIINILFIQLQDGRLVNLLKQSQKSKMDHLTRSIYKYAIILKEIVVILNKTKKETYPLLSPCQDIIHMGEKFQD